MATKKVSTKKKVAKSPAAKKRSAAASKVRATKRSLATRSGHAPPATSQPRHAVFVDVENTNSEQGLFAVLDALAIDRGARTTELVAVGNWRAVGQNLARRLGALGAQLVHSAPARGVRDWSDLWIAVAAGCWLGQSKPGDVLEIISNDRAFDAVGDAAAARGVIYRRLQHRRDVATPVTASAEPKPPRRRTRGGRRRRRTDHDVKQPTTPAATSPAPQVQAAEPHAASRDQVLDVIRRLTQNQAGRWVNLDVLENALKTQGFSRPPGSPRLVTRLRAFKDVEIDSHGRVRLASDTQAA